jgi:outer membrane protein assembly factor BamB
MRSGSTKRASRNAVSAPAKPLADARHADAGLAVTERSERARAIPLATLVAVVAVLVGLKVRERARSAGPASSFTTSARTAGTAASIALAFPPELGRRPGGGQNGEDAGSTVDADAGDRPGAAASMLHGDPRHTGRASPLGPVRSKLGWKTAIGAPIEAQVVASPDEQTLYVAALDGSLTALAAKDGARRWTLALGDRAYSTPCVAPGGTIYVGSDAKRFYAVTPQGSVAWKLETGAGEADTGAVLSGGLVLFAAGSSVFAVRAGGELAWRFDGKKKIFAAPAIGNGGLVVFGAQDHHLYALSPSGALAWAVDLGADVDGAAAIGDDGAIVVGTDAGEVIRLGPAGNVVSRAQVGGYVRGTLSISRNGDALAGVYGPTPRVVRVAPDGSLKGGFAVQGTGSREQGVHGGPLEDGRGALFFGAQDDQVHALGPGGAWEWSFPTGSDVDAPVTLLSNGALVVGSDDGSVYLLDP